MDLSDTGRLSIRTCRSAATEPGASRGSQARGTSPRSVSALALGPADGDGCGVTRIFRDIRLGLAALAVFAAASSARPAEVGGLHVYGDLSGGVKIDALPELGLDWRVSAGADGLLLSTKRAGVDVVVELQATDGGAWRWSIKRAQLDLAELWPLLREKFGASAAGWSASGRVELAGEGALSTESGPVGELRLALREGWARSDELDVELSGLELDAATRDLTGGSLEEGQTLRVAKIAAAGAEVTALKVGFGLDTAHVLRVSAVEADVLGGSVKLPPFSVPLDKPALDAAADLSALRLDEAARLMPWLVQSAQGFLRGRVEMGWSGQGGLRVKDGGLAIVKSDDAAFRLAPSPGLLTAGLPKRYPLLGKWITVKNPAWEPLREIELGRAGLRIETFRVDFWPDGAGRGRTASIHIVGKPTSGKLVKEVKLDINFHGPWSEFLAFGLSQDLSGFSFRFE